MWIRLTTSQLNWLPIRAMTSSAVVGHNVCRHLWSVTKNIPTCWYNIQHIDKRTMENKMTIIMWKAAMSYATTLKIKEWNIIGSKTPYIITNWEPYFVLSFPNCTLVSQRSLISASRKTCACLMLMSSPSAHDMCYTRPSIVRISVT